jgi:site-specific DNA-methyltransferase (adenine-specific)/adenine-specific DNA-methyltransferase
MPTLDWIGKKAVLNHHNEVPFHLLRDNPELSVGAVTPQSNLLVQGDNLLALKALLPYYAGQVKCIYIDPPYNTGNEGWVYNDNVNSPEMREWLGKVVGGEAEDLSRHDKWLCMMYPRLALLREMLREDGSLWMSIDDNEVHLARAILDEIFGANRFVATIIWQKRYAASNDSTSIPAMHDYILVYSKSAKFSRNLLPRTEKQDKAYKNPDNDLRGPWKAADYTCNKTRFERPNLYYPLVHPLTGEEIWPKETRVWAFAKEVYEQHVQNNSLWWGVQKENKVPACKKFLSQVQDGIVPVTWWPFEDVGHTDEAKKEVLKILGSLPGYITPKPTRLIKRIIQIAADPSDIILDAFAGSGTTGDAVIQLNHEDGGDRRFILVEMDSNIAQNITAERLRRVIQGYDWKDQKGNIRHEEGLGGSFRYCELGPTLFDRFGQIRPEVSFADLARHVFFTETGQPLPDNSEESALLGSANGTAVYLLYNGVMRDAGNMLTPQTVEALPPAAGPKVVYADGCRLSRERLRELGITFKQIPYEIRVR